MGVYLNASAAIGAPARLSAARRLFQVLQLVRYRFFLYAGLLPYFLGVACAVRDGGRISMVAAAIGLAGIALSVVGVEAFNEYFDSRMGTDRVFNPEDVPPMSVAVLILGVAAFAGALGTGGYLTWLAGWPVLLFAGLGGMAAAFYVAPPIRWAYRGLGETVIGLSYGPFMVLGSEYLLAGRMTVAALLASLVPGLLIAALAIVNAIPDYHQDRLVGKRNLVVRLGRRPAVTVYALLAACAFGVVVAGVQAGLFPNTALISLLGLPLLVGSVLGAAKTFASPRLFSPAIRQIVTCYALTVVLFIASLAAAGWEGGS